MNKSNISLVRPLLSIYGCCFQAKCAEYGKFITARSRNKKVWQDTSLRGWLVAAQGRPGYQVTLWLQLSKCGDLKWYANIFFISIFPKLLGLIFVYKVADVSAVSLGRDEEWEVCHQSLWISEAGLWPHCTGSPHQTSLITARDKITFFLTLE